MEENKILIDMPADEFKKVGGELINWAAEYFENLESFPVLPNINPGDIKNKLPGSAPAKGESFDKIIEDLNKIILPGVTHWQHPNFMAYFNSTGSMPGVLGELVAAAFSTNGMVWKSNPASTELEETVLNWFRDLIGLPKNYFGIVYDTASVSSMHGIAAARGNTNLDIRQNGLAGAPNLILYCTEHAHSSIDKAVLTLGIGLKNIRRIPCDENYSMIPSELEKAIKSDKQAGNLPFCVVATIGTTSSTAVDPLSIIAGICEKENIWLHVDAAYAGVTAMLPEMKNFFEGLDKADSIVINPHKWLFVPMDFSIFYIRKPDVLKRAFSLVPEYLKTEQDNSAINYMDYGIQLGRRFRSLKFWFMMRYFGTDLLKEKLREHLRIARLFESWIEKNENFELMAPVNFATVCFRFKPEILKTDDEINQANLKLLERINSTGKVFMVNTKLNGKIVLRIVISGLRTEQRHVELAWKIINEEAKLL